MDAADIPRPERAASGDMLCQTGRNLPPRRCFVWRVYPGTSIHGRRLRWAAASGQDSGRSICGSSRVLLPTGQHGRGAGFVFGAYFEGDGLTNFNCMSLDAPACVARATARPRPSAGCRGRRRLARSLGCVEPSGAFPGSSPIFRHRSARCASCALRGCRAAISAACATVFTLTGAWRNWHTQVT